MHDSNSSKSTQSSSERSSAAETVGMRSGSGEIEPLGMRMKYMVCIHFPAFNNVAEYEALINGLRIAVELGIRWLDVRGDSQLVIDQVMKESSCHNAKMAAY